MQFRRPLSPRTRPTPSLFFAKLFSLCGVGVGAGREKKAVEPKPPRLPIATLPAYRLRLARGMDAARWVREARTLRVRNQ
jgi:hypothetical protein